MSAKPLTLLISSFILVAVMAAGEGGAKVTVVSNSAAVTAYWHTMLPDTPMPLAILELLTPPAGNDHHSKHANNNIQVAEEGTADKYIDTSFSKARKIGLHSTKEVHTENGKETQLRFRHQITDTNDKKALRFKGPSTDTDNQRTTNFQLGPATNDQRTAYFRWGPATNDQRTAYFRWAPQQMTRELHIFDRVLPRMTRGLHTSVGAQEARKVHQMCKFAAEDTHDGASHHMHHDFTMLNNTVFLEEALTPGSTVIPYIRPSSIPGGAPLLRRDVADSIPMSTENFTDVMAMFAPASHAMARDVWSTLDICEHLRPVKGEKKTCVTSVESMVEFVASVVASGNTRVLRAFSSPAVPAEGVTSEKRYMVAASRRITEAGDTVTCHNMKFPVAAYMCHAVNPTRVHTVTLESEDVVKAGQRMEALAVCHLDTSEFGAMTMPEHVKPGDAPVCHFISRDSVLWTRAAPAAAA